uniref:Uncharacterized protein n=1 Tax=Phage sp. ctXnn1 TaxID=2826749 RepID=A0A8S5N9E7_9VIRU|nr:MAG TPA: hypothetical protein [Phage sp. ctXnn1]
MPEFCGHTSFNVATLYCSCQTPSRSNVTLIRSLETIIWSCPLSELKLKTKSLLFSDDASANHPLLYPTILILLLKLLFERGQEDTKKATPGEKQGAAKRKVSGIWDPTLI